MKIITFQKIFQSENEIDDDYRVINSREIELSNGGHIKISYENGESGFEYHGGYSFTDELIYPHMMFSKEEDRYRTLIGKDISLSFVEEDTNGYISNAENIRFQSLDVWNYINEKDEPTELDFSVERFNFSVERYQKYTGMSDSGIHTEQHYYRTIIDKDKLSDEKNPSLGSELYVEVYVKGISDDITIHNCYFSIRGEKMFEPDEVRYLVYDIQREKAYDITVNSDKELDISKFSVRDFEKGELQMMRKNGLNIRGDVIEDMELNKPDLFKNSGEWRLYENELIPEEDSRRGDIDTQLEDIMPYLRESFFVDEDVQINRENLNNPTLQKVKGATIV